MSKMTFEEIEMVGKAASVADFLNYSIRDDGVYVETGSARGASGYLWNPLLDDGDALRLAITLRMGISIPLMKVPRIDVITFMHPLINVIETDQNGDLNATTRRAITKMAVKIAEHRFKNNTPN